METSMLTWTLFNVFIVCMLALDLGVFHKKSHTVSMKEALVWSGVWIGLALLFNIGLWYWKGTESALQFFTGYLIEKSLSVDNIFVFLMVFSYFQVPSLYQHKILFWGIIGALIMRAIFIFAGVELIEKFHWTIYIFGALLIFTGIKMALQKDKKLEPDKNPVVRFFKKIFNVTDQYHGDKFFVRLNAKTVATPMFIVLIVIETTDLIFAVDSIPAILAITRDPFIVFTSNVFAILGLRSLYFALAGIMNLFHYLHYGLSAILIFVGGKMMLVDIYKIPIELSLCVVAGILILSVCLSLWLKPKEKVIDTVS